MKEKKQTTEEFDQWTAWEQQTYQTGSTHPPKSHGGIIAFLLVLVIFLCGISTALGLMNIRLFRQLSSITAEEETGPVAFSEFSDGESRLTEGDIVEFSLGFSGQTVPDFWQHYHDLPQGIYVTEVKETSDAHKNGILPGDILISADSVAVCDVDTLQALLETHLPGDRVDVIISRSNNQIALTLTVE